MPRYNAATIQKAIDIYKGGEKSCAKIGKLLGASNPTVIEWIKESGEYVEPFRIKFTQEQIERIGQLRKQLLNNEEICEKMNFTDFVGHEKYFQEKVAHVCKRNFKLTPEEVSLVQNKHIALPKEFIEPILERYATSTLLREDFCKQEGINVWTFNDYVQKYGVQLSKEEKDRRQSIGFELKNGDRDQKVVGMHDSGKGMQVPEIAYNLGMVSTTVRNILAKSGTYKPIKTISLCEKQILEFMRTIDPDTLSQDKSTIMGPKGAYWELDCYSKKYKFAVESCGLYYHSSANETHVRGSHKLKAKLCEGKGIALLLVFDDEWLNPIKNKTIKEMIKQRMFVFDGIKLHARKLILKRLDKNKQYKDFFNTYHLDGHKISSYAYGLFLAEELISCASFKNNRLGELEISRFATNYNYSVRGGFSKLISLIKGPLVSFSNNRLSTGDVYQKTGFVLIQKNKQSYWYTDLKTRFWRTRCKKIASDTITTEEQQALDGVFSQKFFGDSRPLYRIEDCGHKKWKRG